MSLRTTTPFTRYNNDPVLTADQRKILNQHLDLFNNRSFVDPRIIGGSNDPANKFYAEFLHQSFVYVITETVGDYPYPYFSEKTWRAFNTGCPFMLVGAQYSLVKLQEFGFRTFNKFWSEDYDNKNTVADRIESIICELTKLSKLEISELEELRNDIRPVLEYNKQHLSTFVAQDLDNIAKSI